MFAPWPRLAIEAEKESASCTGGSVRVVILAVSSGTDASAVRFSSVVAAAACMANATDAVTFGSIAESNAAVSVPIAATKRSATPAVAALDRPTNATVV